VSLLYGSSLGARLEAAASLVRGLAGISRDKAV
jgi:hypothetical protein